MIAPSDFTRYGSAFDAELLSPTRIDLDMAWSFLERFDPSGLFTFQTFDDSPRKRPALVKVLHATVGNFFSVADTLASLNESGAGVFFTVSRTDGSGRRLNNITGIRALFIDADDLPRPAAWHRTPDVISCRDALHWHAYWRVLMPVDFDLFKQHQQRLALHYRTDPSVCDAARVMRLPGFLHRKSSPQLVRYEVFPNA